MSTLQINNTKYKQFKIAAISSGAALVFGGLAFLQPFSLQDNSYAESSSTEMSVNLDPTITIWTTDTNNNNISEVNISADPDEAVYTGTGRVHVSTNNLTGYTLTIQSNSTDAKMVHENESVTKTIDPLTSSNISKTNWANNSDLNNMWGYSIGNNDSFLGVPGSSGDEVTIDSTEAPNNDNHTDVTFAAKADLSLPAGTYTDTVIFSAVANRIPDLSTITYMQDANKSLCAASVEFDSDNPIATTYELTDIRNNEKYYIRKFADGNCWMVENLYLEGGSAITPEDSNISANYKLPESGDNTFQNNNEVAEMYNGNGRYRNGAAPYSFLGTEYAVDGASYNWCAAVAETGGCYGVDREATGDICPKNWRLPSREKDWADFFASFKDSGDNSPLFATATGAASDIIINSYPYGANVTTKAYWWFSSQSETGTVGFGDYTTTYGPDTHARGIVVSSMSANFGQHLSYKGLGYSVRCILADG